MNPSSGAVLWRFTMSLDGFVAGPDHDMGWMTGFTGARPGLVEEFVATTGARLVRPDLRAHPPPRRRRSRAGRDVPRLRSGRGRPDRAGRRGREERGGALPTVGRQLLELGLIDEIDLHIAPILLGAGIRLHDAPGSTPIRLHRLDGADPTAEANLRYRPLVP